MVNILSVAVFALSLLCVATAEYCKLDTKDCSCIADNGWGVDLRNISGKVFYSAESGDATLVSLCKDSSSVPSYVNGTNGCNSGYSVRRRLRVDQQIPLLIPNDSFQICQITGVDVHGKDDTTSFVYKADVIVRDQGWPAMSKAANESSLSFTFGVFQLRLVCIKDSVDSNLISKDNGTNLHLYTPAACLSLLRPPPDVEGLGTGAVLSIIILVTLFSYCALGIAYNHFVRGTRGVELIPNHDCWASLPGLVMDGIRFIQNGCRPAMTTNDMGPSGRETYDSI